MSTHWMDSAACRGKPPTWWDYEPGSWGRGGAPTETTRQALELCDGCPVRTECLADTMGREGGQGNASLRFGIWGGLTPGERERLARTRRITINRHVA